MDKKKELPGSEQTDEDLSVYLHTIAHELRNPLVSIQGFATLLREKYGESLPEEGQLFLERIVSNVQQAQSLLTDITQLAKVSFNESSFQTINAKALIHTALDSHWLQISQNKINVQIEQNLPVLFCDVKAMTMVFSNLIGNAIKYSRNRKDVNIKIGYLADEIFHKFYIRDNGVGFRAKDRNKVFLLFNRLRNKKNVGGTGLGLTIVKQIIEAHGGEIWVESRVNQGSTFYFTLPKNSQ